MEIPELNHEALETSKLKALEKDLGSMVADSRGEFSVTYEGDMICVQGDRLWLKTVKADSMRLFHDLRANPDFTNVTGGSGWEIFADLVTPVGNIKRVKLLIVKDGG